MVLLREDQPEQQKLVAYIVTDTDLNIPELKTKLSKKLPDYMIPVSYVTLEKFPLTANGKIDRKALPLPGQDRSQLSNEYIAPRTEEEEKISLIIADLLNIEKVGINDNFFELGGHSLLATKFISRVREEFNIELPLRRLFENPTVSGLTKVLSQSEASSDEKIEQLDRGEQDIDQLLMELDGLSDEEVEALLKEEKNKGQGNE